MNIGIDLGLLLEAKLENSLTIGAAYTTTSKFGFNYTNGNFKLIKEDFNDGFGTGDIFAAWEPFTLSTEQFLTVRPRVEITEIASVGVNVKAGVTESVAPVSLSTSGLDGDTKLFGGKIDAAVEIDFDYQWADWLKNFKWAKKISKSINDQIGKVGYKYNYNLFEWEGAHLFAREAYLKVISPIDTYIVKYDNDYIDKHYKYIIKNEGEKKLKWKLEVTGNLKDDLSILPENGELEKGEEITINIGLQKNDLSISPNSVSIKDAKLKFINLLK